MGPARASTRSEASTVLSCKVGHCGQRHNVTGLPADLVILRQALKAAGYTTGMFGKWYIGPRGDYPPAKRGFDEAIVNMGSHFDFRTTSATEYPRGTWCRPPYCFCILKVRV